MGINFYPTFGLGFIFAYFLAIIFQVNKVTATAVSLLFGPAVPLMYALNLMIGGLILSQNTEAASHWDFISEQYASITRMDS